MRKLLEPAFLTVEDGTHCDAAAEGSGNRNPCPLLCWFVAIQETFGLVIHGDKMNPFVVEQLLYVGQLLQHLADSIARGFDHDEQSEGFVVGHGAVHHGLPGEAGSQITLWSGHDSETAHHIVINLATAAIDFRVRRGEVMLTVNPLPDNGWPGQYALKQRCKPA